MKALVLAGGFPQITLIEELKKRGYTVVLADYYENPIAKKYADIFYQASTLDVAAIENIAKKEKVDFLITACTDQALLTVALVSERMGLPCYIDYKTALNVTNKAYMKKVFEENGISTAKHVVLGKLDKESLEGFTYPLIVKPVDCNSSKGVKRVENFKELESAFEDAVNFSRTKTAIVEKYIDGVEVSVDVYVEEGKAHVLSTSRLDKIGEKDKFVIFRGNFPAKEALPVMDKIEKTAQQIADAFHLKNCPMLIQLITDGKEVYVLEFSARTGGGVKFILIKKASGFDVINAVIDLTEGKKPHVEKTESEHKIIVNSFIYCKNGKYDHLEGFDEMIEEGTMTDYFVFKWKGAEFNGVKSSGDRIAGFIVSGDTHEEAKNKLHRIIENIKVISDTGEDIMRHDLLTELE